VIGLESDFTVKDAKEREGKTSIRE